MTLPPDAILGGVETQFTPLLFVPMGEELPGKVVSRLELYNTSSARAKALHHYTTNSTYPGAAKERFHDTKMSTVLPLTTSCAGMATTIGSCVFVPRSVLDLKFPEGDDALSNGPSAFALHDYEGRWIARRPGVPTPQSMHTLQFGPVIHVTTLMTIGGYPFPVILGPPPSAKFIQVAFQAIAQEACAHVDMVLTLTGGAVGLNGPESRDVDPAWRATVVGDLVNVWIAKLWNVDVEKPVRWDWEPEPYE